MKKEIYQSVTAIYEENRHWVKVTTKYHYHPGQGTYYPKTNSYAYYGKV